MASSDERHDFDIRDFLLYAPIGLVYEYQKIIPQLIKRGRSQVQLGMFIGRIAASKGTSGAERVAADALTTMATIAARGVTEFGQVVGLGSARRRRTAPRHRRRVPCKRRDLGRRDKPGHPGNRRDQGSKGGDGSVASPTHRRLRRPDRP